MLSSVVNLKTARVMVLALSLCIVVLPAAAQEGLVAHWDFNEAQGDVLHDRSGNGNDGKLHGPQWVKVGGGHALKFDGVDDYVDCGDNASLDITGPMTLEAWVYLESPPRKSIAGVLGKFHTSYAIYYNAQGRCHWHISGNNFRRSPQLETGSWHHLVGVFESNDDAAVTTIAFYVNGVGMHGRDLGFDHPGHSRARKLQSGKNFLMGCMVPDPVKKNPGIRAIPHFHGMLDDVRVYSRALSEAEVTRNYNEHAEEKGRNLLDMSRFGRFSLTPPCFHFAENEFDVSVDFWGLMPLPKGSEMVATLARPGEAEPLQSCKVTPWPGTWQDTGRPSLAEMPPFSLKLTKEKERLFKQRGDIRCTYANATFSLSGLTPGKYEVRAVLKDKGKDLSSETLVFQYPPKSPEVTSPVAEIVGPLQRFPGTQAYDVELCDGGGFKVIVNGDPYPVESAFSYPQGGENALLASSRKGSQSEPSWTVTTQQVGTKEYKVLARGQHYSVERKIELLPSHIAVTDTIANLTDTDLGIMLNNYLAMEKKDFPTHRLGGVPDAGKRDALHNPTAFVARKGLGLGLVALDDVYVVQGSLYRDEKGATGIRDDKFGLGPKASYTMSWAVYPTGSDDYFDFLNALRNDLGLNGRTVDGPLTCMHRRLPIPEPEELPRGLRPKYISLDALAGPADDPEIFLNGIGFIDFPKEMALLKKSLAEVRDKYPTAYPMFHIAHSLYATNRPERYADSRVMGKNGKHRAYAFPPGGKWISKDRQDAGWRSWAFYPTMDNSFGKMMLQSVDIMMDELGAAGVFADGLMLGYGDSATYDRWDGHTVEIDPKTKTVQRKYGLVQLLSQEAILAWCKKITSKGGAVLVDSGPATLTFARTADCAAYVLETNVNNSCKWVHLAPFPTVLSRTCQFPAPTVYQDILTKLYEGVLWYDFYSRVGRVSIYPKFYPITIEEMHSGFVKGKEKLVTCLSNVYGWPKDRDLHFVDVADGRGILVPHRFFTTVDASGARTRLTLGKDSIAVVKKIPVTVQAAKPVNVIVQQYDAQGIRFTLNGQGEVTIVVRDGEFDVEPNARYSVHAEAPAEAVADGNGTVSFIAQLNGQLTVSLQRTQ